MQPTLCYLGPQGTYTHQAGHSLFQAQVRYVPINTITGLFETLTEATPESNTLAIAPIENSQHGAVIETLDALRLPFIGENVFIRGECGFPIRHSLVVRVGTRREDIRIVTSHPQALGQCSTYLKGHLLQAALKETTSTAEAARSVLEDTTGHTAAICSRLCVELNPGLELMEDNIQDSENNVTRFLILSNSLVKALPLSTQNPVPFSMRDSPSHAFHRLRAMFRIDHSIGKHLSGLVTATYDLLRIDRRPSILDKDQSHWSSSPFCDVYFVTIGERETEKTEVDGDRDSVPADQWLQTMVSLLTILKEGNNTSGAVNSVRLIGVW
ncbi:hypothetical protein FRB96_008556 [Tulasnella sp. 330]|nr:hypothetical protein FRB96_008556 [Tulasnella sp. 330]KAG8873709.1 hypothetical protein FRB97_006527 [Tulasnella sp. 331]